MGGAKANKCIYFNIANKIKGLKKRLEKNGDLLGKLKVQHRKERRSAPLGWKEKRVLGKRFFGTKASTFNSNTPNKKNKDLNLLGTLLSSITTFPSLLPNIKYARFLTGRAGVTKSSRGEGNIKANRKASVGLFLGDIKIIKKCPDTILNCLFFDVEKDRTLFRKQLSKKSGIYMLKYKHDERLFYIGKSVNLSTRLRDHYNRSASYNNRLGTFLKMVGWSNVSVHLIEFCTENELDNRENFYIKKFLPTLNRKFSSLYSSKVYRSLSGLLSYRQSLNRKGDCRLKLNFNHTDPLWVYTYPNFKLVTPTYGNEKSMPFKNISEFKKYFNLNNRIIYKYLDTYTPYKGFIFLSAEILSTNCLSTQNFISSNLLTTPNYSPKFIWAYVSSDLTLLNNTPFKSINSACSFLKINPSTIKTILNKNIAISKGYYFFDHEISDQLRKELLINPNVRDSISKLKVMTWVYDYDLNLLNKFNTQQEMLKNLNLKRVRTINKYKDTGIIFKGFYFFSKEIDIKTKNSILNNRQFAKYNKAKLVWVTQDNKLVNDKPFTSMTSAANFLNLYRKSIAKYIDTNEMFHGYKFFSYNPHSATLEQN